MALPYATRYHRGGAIAAAEVQRARIMPGTPAACVMRCGTRVGAHLPDHA